VVVTADGPVTAPFTAFNRFIVEATSFTPPTGDTPRQSVIVPSVQPAPPAESAVIVWPVVSDWPPPKPTVIATGPVPTPQSFVSVIHGTVDPAVLPQVPIKPVVVGAQPYPPQMAQILTPKGGRFGAPPPILRIIQPQVNTDLSLPFRPNGWARVTHGFAEALPLLAEGTITGGTLGGPGSTGGVLGGYVVGGTAGGAATTGGTLGGYLVGSGRDGYVTGGRR
jgi:hypothetical protein